MCLLIRMMRFYLLNVLTAKLLLRRALCVHTCIIFRNSLPFAGDAIAKESLQNDSPIEYKRLAKGREWR